MSDQDQQADIRPPIKEPSFVTKGKADAAKLLKEASDWGPLRRSPYGLMPALILVGISVFEIFDDVAFSLAAPDIIKELGIEVAQLVNITTFVGFILIFVGLGVAFLADRFKRTPMIWAFTLPSGIFSFFTARASSWSTLAVGRIGHGTGEFVATVPRFSLLADYYPPELRGKAFAMLGTLRRFGSVLTPLAVLTIVAATDTWRTPFYISSGGLLLVGVLAFFLLKEPVRGYMERKSLGTSEEVANTADEPLSFGESWRTIWSVRTLRRFFIADIFGRWADTFFALLFSLYLAERYGLELRDRALLLASGGIFTLIGGFLGGGLIDTLTRRRPQRVLTVFGVFGLGAAVISILQTAGPPLWVLVGLNFILGFFSALIGPASQVVYAQVIPANTRSLGLAVQNLALVPGFIFRFAIAAFFLRRYGLQTAMFATTPFLFIGSLIQLSAAGFFERDMRSALAANLAAEEWRRAKASGRGKLLVSRGVDVEYDGVQVLFGVDFDVEEGEIIALLGTNGAGKSTLLRAISGTQEAASGAIVFDGRDITHMPPHEVAVRGVIHMPGGKGVFPSLSVKENLLLGAWMIESGKEAEERLSEVFEIFPILKERQSEAAGLLSGGEQQMLSLAQGFLGKPRLLMIDELSLGLSPAVVQQLVEIVREINRRGVTVIVVEQSVNVALTVADKAIFMEKGEVKFFGETEELLRRPDILRAVYVKGTGSLTEGAPAAALKSARELRQYELSQARNILEVKNLSKSYGGILAVNDVSFDLKEGEALGLIGPNGAGKTTIFDMVSGYQFPDEGRVILEGADITNLRPDERARKRLTRRFQDAKLFPSLTVYENVLVALDQKLEVRNIVFTSLQLPQVRQTERRVRLRAERLIQLLELSAYRDKFVRELSTGLRRITDLACVLATEPRLLLLDEPSTGIAQAEAEALAPLLRRVRFETGCSMLVIEHDMPLISAVSDELLALDQGTVLLRGTPDEVLNDDRVVESYLGTSEEAIKRSGVLT